MHFLLQLDIHQQTHSSTNTDRRFEPFFTSWHHFSPLRCLWLRRWSGLNSSQMLTMCRCWTGIQGWLHPPPPSAAAINCDKFKTHAGTALSAKTLLLVEGKKKDWNHIKKRAKLTILSCSIQSNSKQEEVGTTQTRLQTTDMNRANRAWVEQNKKDVSVVCSLSLHLW